MANGYNMPPDFGIQEQADYFGRSKSRSGRRHEEEEHEDEDAFYERLMARKLQAELVETQED